MRENPIVAVSVMRGIGNGLGRMHLATVGIDKDEALKYDLRWYEEDGGCCDVQNQIDGKILAKIMRNNSESDDAQNHEFIQFYER